MLNYVQLYVSVACYGNKQLSRSHFPIFSLGYS